MRSILLILLLPAWAAGQTNFVRNPGFEEDADANGVPDAWQTSGDGRLVTQTLAGDAGREGGRSGRLTCTEFAPGNPAAHAMLCQMDVPIVAGKAYRLQFWARAERLSAQAVSVAISDTAVWANCGLDSAFVPTTDWQAYEFIFRGSRDCPRRSRLQFWFTSTGTLWLDDVALTEAGDDLYRPGHVIFGGKKVGSETQPTGDGGNLVPNSGFRCGTTGWGSLAWGGRTHWATPMNRLFGEVAEQDGRTCLAIDLAPERRPVAYFDYFELTRQPVEAPLAGNEGFIEVEPGRPYTFSVDLLATDAETPGLLAVRQFDGRSFEKPVRATGRWQRHALTFTPSSRWCYVMAGPDLRRQAEPPGGRFCLTDVQLEAGEQPTSYRPRRAVEFGLSTEREGNVFTWGEPIVLHVHATGIDPPPAEAPHVALRITDFFDRTVWGSEGPLSPGEDTVAVRPSDTLRGFLMLHARRADDGSEPEQTLRLAVIPPPPADSPFGMNHAYPWPELLELNRRAGLLWVRDWSLKWQEVEPEKGRFTFDETDRQIDRVRERGLKVLGLLPFPSSDWSSSAPDSVPPGRGYPRNRERAAYAPRDPAEFENYVRATVAHYAGRIDWWQCFNEPLYTDYSLPRAKGYDGADYARLVEHFARAVRQADPKARVLAGIGGLHEGVMADFEQFFAAGGLAQADAVDIHHYPRIRPPEAIEPLLAELGALMERHGGRKPIWLTEYGYYADDTPWSVPLPHDGFDQPLASERLQAAYAVRWAAILMSGGVEKIFYHAGTCDPLNGDSLQGVFYEYGGQPHRIYAAQAVLSTMLAGQSPLGRLECRPGVRAYLFGAGTRRVAIVWAEPGERPEEVILKNAVVTPYDLMGRPLAERAFVPSETPVYLQADGLSEAEIVSELRDP